MSSLMLLVFPLVAFALAYGATGRFRRYTLSGDRFLDVPNARSSHARPTPRGGGIAIVAAWLILLPVLAWFDVVPWSVVWGLGGGGALVALVGMWDDAANVHPGWRLLGHFLAAAWVLAWQGGMPPLLLAGTAHNLGWLGHILALLFIVWVLNLTNFMDGIDAIVSVEVVTVCAGGALLYLLTTAGIAWAAPLVFAAATLGFLVWNWPPAKIFMGDAGSGFLGMTLAAFAIQAGAMESALFWSWLILLGAFIVDADVTLLRRVVRGKRIYHAHRSHAYQHAALRYGAHKPVALAVAAINVVWLFPIAAAVALHVIDGGLALAIAYIPLIALVLGLRAGIDRPPVVSPGPRASERGIE